MPINRDPRVIHQTNNGYSYSHQQSVKLLQYLDNGRFLMAAPSQIEIVKLVQTKNTLECSFHDTGSYSVSLEKSCLHELGTPFYHVCSQI